MIKMTSELDCDAGDPPTLPPDKFKVPLAKPSSAFKPVKPKERDKPESGSSSPNPGEDAAPAAPVYDYILRKFLSKPEDISDSEKMIILNHPVIRELVKQAKEKNFSQSSFYIPIESILNCQYFHNATIPILYDSREK